MLDCTIENGLAKSVLFSFAVVESRTTTFQELTLSRFSETYAIVSKVENRIIATDENISQNPQGSGWRRNLQPDEA